MTATAFRRAALLAALACALPAPAVPAVSAAPAPPAQAVVAVVDSGINPYHVVFRDRSPRAYRHPSTYLPGFPRGAVALRLTLDTDYDTAVRRDCARVWSKVKPGTVYWVPGTRIVGAVSFDLTKTGPDCGAAAPVKMPVLDTHGHGTMTASRAVGAPYGACPACLVVSVQFQAEFGIDTTEAAAESARRSVEWAGRNASWIDAQSNSWAPMPVYDPTGRGGLFFENAALTRTVEGAARAQLAFWSSGNGVGHIAGVAGHPTFTTAHFTPSAIRVGGHDSGRVQTWPGFPSHVVADACDSWAAVHDSSTTTGETVGGGTSAAAPYAAGTAAAMLLRARRLAGDGRTGVRAGVVARGRAVRGGPLADGALSLAEWRDLVLRTASSRPGKQAGDGPVCTDPLFGATPVSWSDVPAGAPAYPLIGYGALDRPAAALAGRVLEGAAPLPERADADAFFAADRQLREVTYAVFTAP